MSVGNCGCKVCGLRGWSKNVMTRSIFPIFNAEQYALEGVERSIVAREDPNRPGQYLFGTKAQDWSVESEPYFSLADVLIKYLERSDAALDDLRILLCVHEWEQDPGTNTV